ncbi:hypothetical protein KFL_000570020 [Klebsormidium nitens]|uniref:NAD(P)-binding domain-containing protein n=1 Tax=Klebsormidium nitens TaxID=105231 RepID=A0A0U9HIG8_KLENI|nr:hypothetical protein KFL_000570020 [Klebsormidium nitens]|eukprot:GAQ80553.1 hypothetical protein KFL_000570020 [Klebsormidium nitens]
MSGGRSGAGGTEWEKEVVVEGNNIKEVLIATDRQQPAAAAERAGDAAGDAAESVGEAASEVADSVGSAAEEVRDSVGGAAQESQAAAEDAGEAVVGAAQQVGDTVAEQAEKVGDSVADAAGDAAEALGDAAGEVGEQAQSTLEDAQEFAEDTLEAAQDGADSVQRTLEVEGRSVAARAERAGRKISEENERYVSRVRGVMDIVGTRAQSGDVVGAITTAVGEGFEAADELRRGVTSAVSEAIEGAPVPADTTMDSPPPPQPAFQPAKSGPYTGVRALVAGANGRTGRLLVESLVSKGVPVRALVRDASKARSLRAMRGVTVVQGDTYRYETLQSAIGDSNVVLCATGVRPDIFDPLGPFKYEYEGVVNLVALAKNKDVNKFVLVTSIGTSQLVSPFNLFYGLLWWKKQAELVLQRSGLPYTIVRPGGLTATAKRGNVVFRQADTTFGGAVSRAQVAEACVAALVLPQADNKIVEIVAEENASERSMFDLFSSI